jgi:FkbM family methyltransferase
MDRARQMTKKLYRAIPFKRQLFEWLRQGPVLPGALYQHLHFEGPFTVEIDSGHRFQLQSYGTYVENEIFWRGYGGSWEATSLRVWAALCREQNGLICDIGANTGVYALAASTLAPEALVVAFEPVARMANRLRRNVELNHFAISVEQMAVSDHSGQVQIFDILTDHNYSASLEGQGSEAACYSVEACALDDYAPAAGADMVGPIKIDVERHEPAVMRGMMRLLAAHRPSIIIEILDAGIGAEVSSLIDGLGYRMFHIEEERGLIPTNRMKPKERDWNHLLCTTEDFERAGLEEFIIK